MSWSAWLLRSNLTMLCLGEAISKSWKSCLQVPEPATIPTRFVEDFGCGKTWLSGRIPRVQSGVRINKRGLGLSLGMRQKHRKYEIDHQTTNSAKSLEGPDCSSKEARESAFAETLCQ